MRCTSAYYIIIITLKSDIKVVGENKGNKLEGRHIQKSLLGRMILDRFYISSDAEKHALLKIRQMSRPKMTAENEGVVKVL